MISYILNKPISQVKIIKDIEKLIGRQKSLDNCVLVIKIENIINEDNTLIPKLEHKQS